jgi:hypothetical protein
MKKFIINISLFAVLSGSLYLTIFWKIEKTLLHSDYLDYSEWNDIYSGKQDNEIVIIGSSRARKMVDPIIISQNDSISVYNLGMEGYKIPFQITKYQIYRKRNKKPKICIQIVDHFSLTYRPDLYDIEQFLPYLNNPDLTIQLKKYEGFSWVDYNLPYFRYFGKSNVILAGFLELFKLKRFESTGYKGYYPKNTAIWEPAFDRLKTENPEGETIKLNQEVVQLMDKFTDKLADDSIKHIIIYAPEYSEFHQYIKNRDSISNIYEAIASKHNSTYFIDFKDSAICHNKSLFYNPTHLNKNGAEIFSASINKYLKSLKILYD